MIQGGTMRLMMIIIGLIASIVHDVQAMKRSPRKTLSQASENPKLSARFDKIRGLEWYKVKGWAYLSVSPAEPTYYAKNTKAAAKTHAGLLSERLKDLQ